MKETESQLQEKRPRLATWLKRLTAASFVFFLAKGLFWLGALAAAAFTAF